jgi:hypothetical protein
MASLIGFVRRNYQALYPPVATKADNALKFGILGAANIAYGGIPRQPQPNG